ncbi:unnamed protein product [Nezara viridula]|uniref:Phosphomevalonate kinase n=1 Tax=Nezara viridula TaxID=85310 RepID=A0A9P0HM33_NEZVI|nr:unnamed protein product [Nezara viridula]
MGPNPKCIYIFSGKRKSGKDYVTDRLYDKLNHDNVIIIKLSAPIKSLHAEKNDLDLKNLLSPLEYKEAHRKAMVEWSEKLRNEDYGVFCRAAIQMSKAENYPVWIVSDARRKTDIKWFKENYNNEIIKLYRIVCDDGIRKQRGWEFTEGIDDKETECGLDDFDNWDQIIENNSSDEVDAFINETIEHVYSLLNGANS